MSSSPLTRPRFSEEQKYFIIIKKKEGLSLREIARQFQIGNMDWNLYTETIQTGLKGYWAKFKRDDLIFMQDGASYHQKAKHEGFFSKKGFEPMIWPPNSPDLNPVENIGAVIKNQLWKRRKEIKNSDDTFKLALEIWFIGEDLVRKIYRSLPKRCEKVIKYKGLRIKTH